MATIIWGGRLHNAVRHVVRATACRRAAAVSTKTSSPYPATVLSTDCIGKPGIGVPPPPAVSPSITGGVSFGTCTACISRRSYTTIGGGSTGTGVHTSTSKGANTSDILPSSFAGGGNRVFTDGSGIGSDSSMIAANNRLGGAKTLALPNDCNGLLSTGDLSLTSPSAPSCGNGQSAPLASPSPSSQTRARAASTHRHCHLRPTSPLLATLASSSSLSPSSRSLSLTPLSRSRAPRSSLSTQAGIGGMNDEYGEMTSEGHTFAYPGPFTLESGQILLTAKLRYMTYGTLNDKRDNVLVICHALTGNASLHSWWGDLLGPGLAFDTSKYFVVCANILGSCYGSTGPASPIVAERGEEVDDEDEEKKDKEDPSPSSSSSNTVDSERELYGVDFPDVSVQDTVRLQLHMLQDSLNVNSVKCVIGGSFGGMQAVEYAAQAGAIKSPFAVNDPCGRAVPFVRSVVPIACGAAHTAWQIAISEVQRQAIYADPKWNAGRPSMDDPPLAGLSVARQIGMVSYRTARGYEEKFGRTLKDESVKPPYGAGATWEVKSYLEYQGYKFLSRFDPITYVKLTEQMDTHDVGRNRGGRKEALSSVRIPALVLGIDSDVLYPLHEQEELASLFPNGELKVIKSDAGHDGFLLEQEQVAAKITDFLAAHD